MHPKAIEALTARITTLAYGLVYPVGLPNAGTPILTLKQPTSSFAVGSDDELQAILTLLLDKQKWSLKWSSAHLQEKVLGILRKVVDRLSTDDLAPDVQALVDEYEAFDTRLDVFVPVVGLTMTIDQLALGRVTLHREGSEAAKAFAERCRSIIMRNETYKPDQRQEFWEQFERNFWSPLQKFVCAEFSAVADRKLIEDRALTETRRAVDLLRFTLLFAENAHDRTRFGIQGETATEPRKTVAVNEGNTRSHYLGSMVNHVFRIDDEAVKAMEAVGVFELSDLLKGSDLTEFEEALLTAVHWLSSGQNQDEKENAVLNFVTALEVLINPSATDPITTTVAESTALLLGDDLDARRRIRDRVKALYGLRSGITHGEKRQIADQDMADLTAIARNLTVRLIRRRREFPDKTKLREWLDEQKLGGPPNSTTTDAPDR